MTINATFTHMLYFTDPDFLNTIASGSDHNPDMLVGKKIIAEVLSSTSSDEEQRIRVKSAL